MGGLSAASPVVKVVAATGISLQTSPITHQTSIYNLAGQKVGTDYKGLVVKNGRKFIQK